VSTDEARANDTYAATMNARIMVARGHAMAPAPGRGRRGGEGGKDSILGGMGWGEGGKDSISEDCSHLLAGNLDTIEYHQYRSMADQGGRELERGREGLLRT
jgi:hypothetical protein